MSASDADYYEDQDQDQDEDQDQNNFKNLSDFGPVQSGRCIFSGFQFPVRVCCFEFRSGPVRSGPVVGNVGPVRSGFRISGFEKSRIYGPVR